MELGAKRRAAICPALPLKVIQLRARATFVRRRGPARLEPGSQAGEIVLAQSKAFAILFRRQPVLIIGRSRVALLFEELFEIFALQIGLGEDELDAVDSGSGIQHAAGFDDCEVADASLHRDRSSGFNRAPDAIFRGFPNSSANTS